MSPERALILPEETIVTPKMSVPASPIAGTPTREAQSPMSILLAVAQSQVSKTGGNGDDDLTNLAWLHERDLLKGMNIVNPSPSNSLNSTPIKYTMTNNNSNNNNNNLLSDQSPTSDYIDDSSASTADSSNSSLNSPIPSSNVHHQNVNSQQRNKHPHNVLYDPLVHTNSKPPYSFSCLIFMAIEDSDQKALPVKEIYTWILDHFPYFKTAPMGWKNSVRHNLSLNKCFQKIEKAPNLGKGSLWTVDQQYRPNLLQALTRSPFHRCSTLDPSVYFNNNKTKTTNERSSNVVNRLPNPQLFPYLASEMNRRIKSEPREDSLDEVDAAAVMLSLRNGLRHRQKRTCQVITSSPSQDHTYSAADNYVDEAFESDEEDLKVSKSSICRRIDFEDEEERKIKEGAETLLNLAGITTRKRGNSSGSSYDVEKRIKKEIEDDDDDEDEDQNIARPQHFRPRLLRKKKDVKRINNNNSIVVQADDAWVKHRRELEMNQRR